MQKAAVILGAGASHGVWNEVGPKPDGPPPPVTDELFGAQFDSTLQTYPGAVVVGALLRSKMGARDFNFERELAHIARREEEGTQADYKDVLPYLREVLSDAGHRYGSGGNSHTTLVDGLLRATPHETAYIILNYDNLLERALVQVAPDGYGFASTDDYAKPGRDAKVFKLHGSVDWVRELAERTAADTWHEAVRRFDVRGLGHAIHVVDDIRPGFDIRDPRPVLGNQSASWVYPVLAEPLGEKNPVCPQDHLNRLRGFLVDCTKYLVIGTRGLDPDVRDVLSAVRRVDHVHYVGMRGVEGVKTLFERSIKAFQQTRTRLTTGATILTYDQGYRSYLASGAFDEFLSLGT